MLESCQLPADGCRRNRLPGRADRSQLKTDSHKHPRIRTACVVRKNYRLQDIQLSKIRLRGFAATARQVRETCSADLPRNAISLVVADLACPAEARHGCSRRAERRLVENTGLEPVTSWLQTRRSPS